MFQILNLTELELDRVDVRVGLTGALYYMDGSSQAVRQLRNLVSQVSPPPLLKCIVCVVLLPVSDGALFGCASVLFFLLFFSCVPSPIGMSVLLREFDLVTLCTWLLFDIFLRESSFLTCKYNGQLFSTDYFTFLFDDSLT